MSYVLGHDQHGHPLSASVGCTGSDHHEAAGHEGAPNLRAVFAASYTDAPEEGAPPLTGTAQVVLTPGG